MHCVAQCQCVHRPEGRYCPLLDTFLPTQMHHQGDKGTCACSSKKQAVMRTQLQKGAGNLLDPNKLPHLSALSFILSSLQGSNVAHAPFRPAQVQQPVLDLNSPEMDLFGVGGQTRCASGARCTAYGCFWQSLNRVLVALQVHNRHARYLHIASRVTWRCCSAVAQCNTIDSWPS